MENWKEIFPEINLIKDSNLIQKIEETCQDALDISGMTSTQFHKMPFTLLIPNTNITYLEHVQSVIKMAVSACDIFKENYDSNQFPLNKNFVIAGAILHDVGKILEYQCNKDNVYITSPIGKNLRHPFSGTGLAMKHHIPYEICHIIATHAGEGNGRYRSPESVLINRIDDMNFVMLKAYQNMI